MGKWSICHVGVLLILLMAGCGQRKAAVVKVTCSYRASAPFSDECVAAPMVRRLSMAEGVEKITAISAKGKTELYLTGRNGFSTAEMLDSVKRSLESAAMDLPHNAAIAGVVELKPGQPIPTVQPRLIPSLSVLLDHEKLARLGIALPDIETAIQSLPKDEPATDQSVAKAIALSIPTGDGKQIPLGEVATVKLLEIPNAVIRTFP